MVSSIKTAAQTQKKNYQTPIYTPIVEGHFPSYKDLRELAIFKINRFLGSVLILAVIASMVSYSMVIAKETAVSSIHAETNEINFDNIELQNKVDQAKSFYNVNDKVAKVSFLKKPDKILEVNVSNPVPVVINNKNDKEIKLVTGY